MVAQHVSGTVFVIGNDRQVRAFDVVDTERWGKGYLVVRGEDGEETITEVERCFVDESSAERAASSQDICRQIGVNC